MIAWHYAFVAYVDATGFVNDVFRLNFVDNLMPFYGRISRPVFNHLSLALLIGPASYFFFREKKYSLHILLLYYFFCCILFSISDNPLRFSNLLAHYEAYALDLGRYHSVAEIFRNYNALQVAMDIHNQHYPPANLLILFIFNKAGMASFTWIFYLLVFCISIFLVSKKDESPLPLLLTIATPGMLIFPSLDNVLIAAACMYAMYRLYHNYFAHKKNRIPIAMSLVAFIFSMFSFVIFVAGIFFFLLIIMDLYHNKHKYQEVLKLLAIALFTFLLLHMLTYIVSGFNWYQCLNNSVALNKMVMQTNGFDSVSRYLLRATGNIFGLLISMGLVSGLFFLVRKKDKNVSEFIAYILTVVIASFSGLFFMETERVFLFLIPTGMYIVSPLLKNIDTRDLQQLAMLNLIFAALQEIFLKHFL